MTASYESGGNSMPGVHSKGFMIEGRTTQSIWMKGIGYTLVGLISSDEEKQALVACAGHDWSKFPFMTIVPMNSGGEDMGEVYTIEVDQTEKKATLYISDKHTSGKIEPFKVWE